MSAAEYDPIVVTGYDVRKDGRPVTEGQILVSRYGAPFTFVGVTGRAGHPLVLVADRDGRETVAYPESLGLDVRETYGKVPQR
jgi:hypothetical protein